MQDYRKLSRVAESSPTRDQRVRTSCSLQDPKGWALRDQILKAVISIPSNIAEGAGRGSRSRTLPGSCGN